MTARTEKPMAVAAVMARRARQRHALRDGLIARQMRQSDAPAITLNGNPAGNPIAPPPGDATLTCEQTVTGQRPDIQTMQIFTGQAMGCSAHT